MLLDLEHQLYIFDLLALCGVEYPGVFPRKVYRHRICKQMYFYPNGMGCCCDGKALGATLDSRACPAHCRTLAPPRASLSSIRSRNGPCLEVPSKAVPVLDAGISAVQ